MFAFKRINLFFFGSSFFSETSSFAVSSGIKLSLDLFKSITFNSAVSNKDFGATVDPDRFEPDAFNLPAASDLPDLADGLLLGSLRFFGGRGLETVIEVRTSLFSTTSRSGTGAETEELLMIFSDLEDEDEFLCLLVLPPIVREGGSWSGGNPGYSSH